MKENTSYTRVTGYLHKIFKYVHEYFFAGELPAPTITIQSTPRCYGHFTPWKSWTTSKDGEQIGQVEINLGAETLNRPIENTVATMIHECVHYYCYLHNIKDTSRNGSYHNKRFKAEAEKRGLTISYDGRIGWSITEPGEDVINFCIEYNLQDIFIHRNGAYYMPAGGTKGTHGKAGAGEDGEEPKKKTNNSIKWVCPECGMIARTTKICRMMCMDCMKELEKA